MAMPWSQYGRFIPKELSNFRLLDDTYGLYELLSRTGFAPNIAGDKAETTSIPYQV